MITLNVLDRDRELLDIVDYASEVLWTKKFYDVGGCVFRIPASEDALNFWLYEAKYITRDDDDMVCVVTKIKLAQSIDTGTDELTITCLSITSILSQRQVWEQFNYNYSADICMRFLVQQNFIDTTEERVISYIKLGILTEFGPTILKQVAEESNVLVAIQEIALAYNIGFKFVMDIDKNFVFTLYQGTDRSINQIEVDPIEFSPGQHNLNSFTFEFDRSEEKNVAIVVGEGEGINRKKVVVGTSIGINRKELFIDGSSASSNEGTITDYNAILEETGRDILSEHAATKYFNFEIDANSYRYREDFELGDIITVKADYGLSVDAKIVEVIESWYSSNEYQVKINVEV